MNYRRLGRTGWMVSEIGYGMWGMASWTGSSDAESQQSLQRAIDLGCNFFDTAWHYGSGAANKCSGSWCAGTLGRTLCGHQDPSQESCLAGPSRVYA